MGRRPGDGFGEGLPAEPEDSVAFLPSAPHDSGPEMMLESHGIGQGMGMTGGTKWDG